MPLLLLLLLLCLLILLITAIEGNNQSFLARCSPVLAGSVNSYTASS